ncbi:hypothetical protein AC579_9651 [Pseudocercospora musae]|uniref:Uncharacterized protein n=1 Tax=Pseudocercospora musae TaxID=113226 RepID=A0A139IJ38_9PEZI|nr:hypothetical protein AC579_9651 [Pseudocercospora musae]
MADQSEDMDRSQAPDGFPSRNDSAISSAESDASSVAEDQLSDSNSDAIAPSENPSADPDQNTIASPGEEGERPTPSLQTLPQELRDEIYSYLLDADAVKYTPDYKSYSHSFGYSDVGSTAHTYRFETALLSINKFFAEDARRYFTSKNVFTIFNFHCPGMRHMLHICDVPVVADHGLDDFDGHTFSVELCWTQGLPPIPTRPSIDDGYDDQWYANPGDDSWIPIYGDRLDEELACLADCHPEDPDGLVLILEQDLPKLWSMLRLAFLLSIHNSPSIITQPGEQLKTYQHQDIRSVAMMNLSENDSLPTQDLLPDRKGKFLRGVKTVTGAGYHLTLHGFNNQEAEEVRSSTAPDFVWLRAWQWDAFDVLNTLKQHIDDLARKDHYGAAEARYNFLASFCDPSIYDTAQSPAKNSRTRHQNVASSEGPECISAAARVGALALDIKMSQAWILMKKNQTYEALIASECLLDDISTPGTCSAILQDSVRHLFLLAKTLEVIARSAQAEHDCATLAPFTLAELRQLSQDDEYDDYVLHDIAMLSSKLERSSEYGTTSAIAILGQSVSWDGILRGLSIFTLPFRPFDSKADHITQRPAGLKS